MADLSAKTEAFFARYGELMNAGIAEGKADTAALAACFAPYFVGSSPQGVFGGEAGTTLQQMLGDGIENYRRIGGTAFIIDDIEVADVDPLHAMARVSWRFDYKRPSDGKIGSIRFANEYLVSFADEMPRIFAWVTPDEQAALEEHGLV
jgi:hypothetical protein